MQSPVGSHRTLVAVELDEGLTAYQCPETLGIWLPSHCYLRWLQRQQRLAHLPPPAEEAPIAETDRINKPCPETSSLMQPFRVGHGFNFRIDRSITGGIWLDGGEWEQLKERSFHDELHLVFTAPWQKANREAQQVESNRQLLEEKLGADLFEKVDEVRERLEAHPARQETLAFLMR
ncbi:MAG: hypothetical protein AAF585_22940 [Verrucomicrobiota bacterium]